MLTDQPAPDHLPSGEEDKWLVGLEVEYAGTGVVRLYYILDHATGRRQAQDAALRLFHEDREQTARAGGPPERVRGVEVQRIHQDPLGELILVRCA
ncbi:hypothetical protein ABZ614_11385 [Streptomyces sp. NPDC013178]|uniref:hypothetical protein n=1 Tax=Streptomyces sp. NPDC013178 TaxID=3155118 RepID=UPI0033F586E8